MRRLRSILATLLLALLIPALLNIRGRLPTETRAMIGKKYGGWSGVLRLWVFEGWTPGEGGLAAWLNRCIASFERAHEGVYVQPQYVDAGAIAALNDSGILPPDAVLIPPGLLETPAGLAPLEISAAPREALSEVGAWGGRVYALPVAMGGTLWAYDAAALSGIPADWSAQEAVPACPVDEPFQHWGSALLALCAGAQPAADDGPAEPAPVDGVDLGLAAAPATPVPTHVPDVDDAPGCTLPPDFAPSEDAFRAFLNGDAAAVPVTQREIRRLEALSDQGRGPDWRLASGKIVFSDQFSSIAVVDGADADRVELARAFAAHLLSDACQGELHCAGAFSVTGAASGYPAGDALLALEQALRANRVAAPPVFGAVWAGDAASIVREFLAGRGGAPALWRRLAAILDKKPNISGGNPP